MLTGRSYYEGTGSFTSSGEISGRQTGSRVEANRRQITTGARYSVGTSNYIGTGQIGVLLGNAPTITNRVQIRAVQSSSMARACPCWTPADANTVGLRGAPVAPVTNHRRLLANTPFSEGRRSGLTYSRDQDGRAIAGAGPGKQRLDLGVNGTADVPADSPGWSCYPISGTWPSPLVPRVYRADTADVIDLPDIPQVDITLSPTETARLAAADVISLPDITWLTLQRDSGGTIRVDQNNTREGALTFASTGTAPLFHLAARPSWRTTSNRPPWVTATCRR